MKPYIYTCIPLLHWSKIISVFIHTSTVTRPLETHEVGNFVMFVWAINKIWYLAKSAWFHYTRQGKVYDIIFFSIMVFTKTDAAGYNGKILYYHIDAWLVFLLWWNAQSKYIIDRYDKGERVH